MRVDEESDSQSGQKVRCRNGLGVQKLSGKNHSRTLSQ